MRVNATPVDNIVAPVWYNSKRNQTPMLEGVIIQTDVVKTRALQVTQANALARASQNMTWREKRLLALAIDRWWSVQNDEIVSRPDCHERLRKQQHIVVGGIELECGGGKFGRRWQHEKVFGLGLDHGVAR